MRTTLPFVLLFLGISTLTFSQNKTFDISEFERPEFNRRALAISGSMDGANSYSDQDASTSMANSDFQGSLSGFMSQNQNDSSRQLSTSLGLFTSLSYARASTDSDLDDKQKAAITFMRYNRTDRKYYKPGRFFEINADSRYTYFYSNRATTTDISDDKQKGNYHIGYAFLPLKIGRGRIELVQDARHAVLVEHALRQKGRLVEAMDDQTMNEFAHLISALKNQRFYDSRLQNIRELEAIGTFLMDRGLVTNCDAQYFATLSDIWDFGGGPIRESGKRVSIILEPGVYLSDGRNETIAGELTNSTELQTYAAMASAGVDFVHTRPLSIQWQNDIEAHVVFGISTGSTSLYASQDGFDSFTTPSFRVGASQAWGFYPNTRTEVQFSYGADYINYLASDDLNEQTPQNGGQGVLAKVGLETYYYISPRTRLSASYGAFGRWSDPKGSDSSFQDPLTSTYYLRNYDDQLRVSVDQTDIQQEFSIRLSHSIY